MDICHLYDYEYQARIDARKYAKEHYEDIKRVVLNNSSLRIWTKDGNTHHFMSGYRYVQWAKGRTYMLSDGTMMHSIYPIKFHKKNNLIKEQKNEILLSLSYLDY